MKQIVRKTVNLSLIGIDGNAYVIMGKFQAAAKRDNWTQREIDLVLDEAQSSDYDHLLQTIMLHTNS